MDNTGEELLPVNVKVRVGYKGTSVEKQQNVSTTPHYDFATVSVTADLKDSNGGLLTADSWQYRFGYGPYSTLDNTGEELLPVNVKVRVGYNSTTDEKQQNVGTNPYYEFFEVGLKFSEADITEELSDFEISIYPNPVIGSATITYSIESDENVNILVYNSLGIVVEKLFDANQKENSYELKWNTNHLNPGIYYVRFIIGNEQTVKPVIVK